MKIRLTEPCFFNNHMHQAGEVIDLPDGMRGPHRAERRSHDRIDYQDDPPIDANRMLGRIEDVPLFESVKEDGQ